MRLTSTNNKQETERTRSTAAPQQLFPECGCLQRLEAKTLNAFHSGLAWILLYTPSLPSFHEDLSAKTALVRAGGTSWSPHSILPHEVHMEEILVLVTLCFMRAGNVILMCRFRVLKSFSFSTCSQRLKEPRNCTLPSGLSSGQTKAPTVLPWRQLAFATNSCEELLANEQGNSTTTAVLDTRPQ